MTQPNKLLQRPLYVFDLPQEILTTLHSRSEAYHDQSPSLKAIDSDQHPDKQNGESKPATSCALCGLSFASFQEQRSHVRSDLHAYNVKQRARGQSAVQEAEFEHLLEKLDESLSGSDTSEDDEGDEEESGSKPKDSTLSALLKRQAKLHDGNAEDAPSLDQKSSSGNPPLVWFRSSLLPSNTSLGIYRAIFSAEEQKEAENLVNVVQRKQLKHTTPSRPVKAQDSEDNQDGGVPLPASMQTTLPTSLGPSYFLCMIGGGHFAAMLVSLTPKLTKKGGVEDRSASVIAHKTFHRYTTRRKQGGSQSANDNAKGNAHSAGAGLRRYNEAALEKDVRDLLTNWKSAIDAAELVFVRATGVTNRRTLFGPYDGQVLSSKDDRIRGFPFSTKRATQSELMRAFVELTRVKISTVDEEALARQAEAAAYAQAAAAKALANSTATPQKSTKPSKADEEATLHTSQIQALIKRSKAPGLVSYLQTNNLSPEFCFFPADQNYHAPTSLHFAAHLNSAACITALLIKLDGNPNIRNAENKTPFDLAGDRPTRDAFRLARSLLGESRWPWDEAGVPTALSQSEVDARTAREKGEKAAEEAAEKQRREAEVERLRKEDMDSQASKRDAKFGKGYSLSEKKMTPEERRMEQARGMTDEMRMKLEREKRARAAEERMKRLQGH